ncbi:MAG: Fis family transcriptional regulator [Gammaproteobacteria bacterium]|nr:Fis family transcriptional regulator [Gammaproteobacteria bacterium]MBQ0838985.1 Fis family transcriptional regulator [Gammaproteobacteria bacterium]
MKKTDKKIEKAITQALTEVCGVALDEVAGFEWLTHIVNYSRFPGSLSVVCIFATDSDLTRALLAKHDDFLRSLIADKLSAVGIVMKDMARQVSFDSEEACAAEHGGRWQERLS